MSIKPKKYIINLQFDREKTAADEFSFIKTHISGECGLHFPLLEISMGFINFLLANYLVINYDLKEQKEIMNKFSVLSEENLYSLYDESIVQLDEIIDYHIIESTGLATPVGDNSRIVSLHTDFQEFKLQVMSFTYNNYEDLFKMAATIRKHITKVVELTKISLSYTDKSIKANTKATGLLLFLKDPESIQEEEEFRQYIVTIYGKLSLHPRDRCRYYYVDALSHTDAWDKACGIYKLEFSSNNIVRSTTETTEGFKQYKVTLMNALSKDWFDYVVNSTNEENALKKANKLHSELSANVSFSYADNSEIEELTPGSKNKFSSPFLTRVWNKGRANIAAGKPPVDFKILNDPHISVRMGGKTYQLSKEQYLRDARVKEVKCPPFSVEEMQQRLKELFPELNIGVKRGHSIFNKKPFEYLDAIRDQLEVRTQEETEKSLVDNLNLSSLKFNTPRDRIIFGLTKLTGEERLRFLGIKKEHLGDRKKNNAWFQYTMTTLGGRDSIDSHSAYAIIWAINDCLHRNLWPVDLDTDTFK
jgi:hypothetical protein